MFVKPIITVCITLFFSALLYADSLNGKTYMKKNTVLVEFENELNRNDWQVTSDGVMGGLSVGNTELKNEKFIFSGNISTENYGGFTSVYKRLSRLPEDVEYIDIRVMGDGKRYQLRVRSQINGYDVAYKIGFDTKMAEVETHTFNLADFQASFRGRIIGNAPTLKAATISHVGFLLTTKQPQKFSLSVHMIEFYQRVPIAI